MITQLYSACQRCHEDHYTIAGTPEVEGVCDHLQKRDEAGLSGTSAKMKLELQFSEGKKSRKPVSSLQQLVAGLNSVFEFV